MIKNKILNSVDSQILIFIFLVPFINIYEFFIGGKIEIFNFSLIEIIKVLIISYLFIITIISKKDKLKQIYNNHKKAFISFLLLFIIFIICHIISILTFDTSIINLSSHNVFIEIYYIFRTYFIILVLFATILLCDIDKEKIIKTISRICFIICLIIVVSNLFKIGYASYSPYLTKECHIEGNIFDWFTSLNSTNADLYTTKGFFYSANQLSLVILPSLAISALYLIQKRKKHLYLSFFVKIIGALMVSTKISALGTILLLLIIILGIPLFNLIRHQKNNIISCIYFIIALAVYLIFFKTSPIAYREKMFSGNSTSNTQIQTPTNPTNPNENISNISDENFIETIKNNHWKYSIHSDFIELYKPENNIEFWRDAINLSKEKRQDFRYFKKFMYNYAIKKNDHEVLNYLFGIGYVSNFPYLERDFIGQIAWFGIIGCICLIGPYILLFIMCIMKFFKNIKKYFVLENLCFLLATGISILGSLVAGHLFGNLFPMTILILLLKYLFDTFFKNNNGEKNES